MKITEISAVLHGCPLSRPIGDVHLSAGCRARCWIDEPPPSSLAGAYSQAPDAGLVG